MTVSLLLIVAMMAIFVGWLLHQTIAVRPWVADSGRDRPSPPASQHRGWGW